MTDDRLRQWAPFCQSVALLLGPYAEVVLHDALTDQVLQIWHPMTDRRPGDPSDLGELDDLEPSATDVYGPYQKILADGRRLTSVSSLLRGPSGEVSAVLCINLDRSPLDQAAAMLTSFAAATISRPEPLFEHDWSERIQHIVGQYVRDQGRPIERLTRDDKLAVLTELDAAGVLAVRRSIPVIATALKSSRSTIYAMLADLKKADTPR